MLLCVIIVCDGYSLHAVLAWFAWLMCKPVPNLVERLTLCNSFSLAKTTPCDTCARSPRHCCRSCGAHWSRQPLRERTLSGV